MKLNKTNLNKLIRWTSSKFNEYNKDDIIDRILRLQADETFECSCGSYGKGAWNGGYRYTIYRFEDKLVIKRDEHYVSLEV